MEVFFFKFGKCMMFPKSLSNHVKMSSQYRHKIIVIMISAIIQQVRVDYIKKRTFSGSANASGFIEVLSYLILLPPNTRNGINKNNFNRKNLQSIFPVFSHSEHHK